MPAAADATAERVFKKAMVTIVHRPATMGVQGAAGRVARVSPLCWRMGGASLPTCRSANVRGAALRPDLTHLGLREAGAC